MKEIYEIRLYEREAGSILAKDEGVVLSSGLARLLKTNGRDALFHKIQTIARTRALERRPFVSSVSCTREYTKKELNSARALLLLVPRVFEPAGEELGTVYDESQACSICGFGAMQVTPLRIPRARIPKLDLSRTIAGEIVASSRFRSVVEAAGLSGVRLEPVESAVSATDRRPLHFQLRSQSDEILIASPPTQFGINAFDEDAAGEYRCPAGHVLGLNRLSELSLHEGSVSGDDLALTASAAGVRRGLLRPEPFLVVSPKFYRAATDARLSGLRFEVAHLI